MEISGTAAIVTGGASGLGLATARALAARGAAVFALDLSTDNAPDVEGVTYLAADVTSEEDVQAAVDTAAGSGSPLRVVVNCAGIGPSARTVGKSGPHPLDLYRKVIDVNLVGTFNVLRLAAAAMGKTEPLEHGQRGVVINTASIAAYDGQIGQVAYAARDLSSVGVRVMTIAPGIVDTPMLATVSDEFRAGLAAGVPFPKRLALPEEYGRLAVSIVEHDYLNGEVIRMDGALRMAPR